jgi:UDP-GlcNAc3NAcA epimerase
VTGKVLTVLGARPQVIKASVVTHAITRCEVLDEIVLHTGQHFDANMSAVFYEEFGLSPPDYQLDINGGTHGAMTARMLLHIEEILLDEKPAAVLVYGDTNSTLAGALAAVKLRIPVAHVEAGLRSFNMDMPEEVNRIVTDRVSDWLYTPTAVAEAHLLREGIPREKIVPVGDVMYDVARHYGAQIGPEGRVLEKLGLSPNEYILVTIHRAESTDHPQVLRSIVDALGRTAARMPVVWPMHPRTRRALAAAGTFDPILAKMHVIEPTGYLDMVQLEKYASVIATDSGGVQKEAFFHETPCVTIRTETEWVELIEAGWNRLASPSDSASIVDAISDAIGSRGERILPYGDGDAADRIVAHLADTLVHRVES